MNDPIVAGVECGVLGERRTRLGLGIRAGAQQACCGARAGAGTSPRIGERKTPESGALTSFRRRSHEATRLERLNVKAFYVPRKWSRS